MKVLLIAPLHYQREYYKQKTKGYFLSSQGHSSWIEALNNLGHKVKVFRSNDSDFLPNNLTSSGGFVLEKLVPKVFSKYMNAKNKLYRFVPSSYVKNSRLKSVLENFSPDLILLSGGTTEIFPETLESYKRSKKAKVFLIEGVNPQYAATASERQMLRKGIVDMVVENDEGYARGWEKIGAKKVLVLPMSSVDPKKNKKMKLTSGEEQVYSSDVCFVGTLNNSRQRILETLTNFNLKIWGDIPAGTKISSKLKPFYFGLAHGEKMSKIFSAAKISINIQPSDMKVGGNMRTFEIPACGSLQIADRIDPNWFVVGREVVLFKGVKDLANKVSYFLKNDPERKRIAEAGFKRANREHTYEKHFSTLLSKV